MQPPSPHSNFFSSLKRLEKRLKLDAPSSPNQQNFVLETSSESQSSPLYLNSSPLPTTTASDFQESEIPQEFLTNSPDFTPTLVENPPQESKGKKVDENGVEVDDIALLMELLGLSECGSQRVGEKLGCDDDGFYGEIVGVKGIKSRKELERIDGWIKHFLNEGNGEKGRIEPLRLAHLLLGKSAFLHSMDSDGSGGLEFPSTIDEFLQNDPPSDEV